MKRGLFGVAAAVLFAAACADVGSVGVALDGPSSVDAASADRRRPVDASDVPPGAKADSARVPLRHALRLIGARVTADGRIVRDGELLGRLRARSPGASGDVGGMASIRPPARTADASPGPPMVAAADGDEQECWYWVVYWSDTGEIVHMTLLSCGGGGSEDEPECTEDQKAIAKEYGNDGEWPCDKFDDSITTHDMSGNANRGTHGHDTGYIDSDYRTGRRAVLSYMRDEHSVTGIKMNSDWRCPDGNATVRGKEGSAHVKGLAGDFDHPDFDDEMAEAGRVLPGVVALALLAPAPPLAAQEAAPMTEREAAALLADGDWRERDRGLEVALELGPRAGDELRLALIDATWAELRGGTDTPPESEAILAYLNAVVELRDPRAIPVMVEALSMGGTNHLADFGAEAFAPVLAAVSDPDEHRSRVGNGLTVLRFLLGDGVLGAGQLERTRAAVRERLSGTQDFIVAKAAARLALALGDPELREIVERIASDRAVAEALVSPHLPGGKPMRYHARTVDNVQKYARTFLDGGGADRGPTRRPGGN